MHWSGEEQKETIRPEFDRSIMIDFQGAKITWDTGFLLLREIDERFGILGPIESELEDARSWVHSKHSLLQMTRQRICQVGAGYEDCNDADFLRIAPALRLAIGKGDEAGAGQSRLSRLENEVLGTEAGSQALEDSIMRSNDTLMRRKKKQRLSVDVDSTEDPAHGKQENVAFNGHFGKNCFHPLFAFTSDGDCLGAKLRPGNVHSADGILEFLDPIVHRYRSRFVLFWLRGDAAFADPAVYEYCEAGRVTYFIRLPANAVLNRLLDPYLTGPLGRPPKSGIHIRLVDLRYRHRPGMKSAEWLPRSSGTRENFFRGSDSLSRIRGFRRRRWSRCTTGAETLRTGSKRGRTRCAGTRRVAVALRPTKLVYSWESWHTTSFTCSGNSTSRARKSSGQWNGSSSV